MKLMNVFVYVLLAAASFVSGTMYQKNQRTESRYCATVAEIGMEIQVNSCYALTEPTTGTVLAVLETNELASILKDPRLKFHACTK